MIHCRKTSIQTQIKQFLQVALSEFHRLQVSLRALRMPRLSHDERSTGSARRREPTVYPRMSRFFFMVVQFQMFTASNNSEGLCVALRICCTDWACVSLCLCVCVFVRWLCGGCALMFGRAEKRRAILKQRHFMDDKDEQVRSFIFRVNLFKSHLTARVRSRYCCRCCR